MPTFHYTAKNSSGRTIRGSMVANSADNAAEVLHDKELIIVHLKATEVGKFQLQSLIARFNKVPIKEITFFARQLSVLVNASIPLVRSLKVLSGQTTKKHFRDIINNIASDVEGGTRFSEAMTQYPYVFDQFFIHMVRAGETTGRLDEVLLYLADQKEKDYALRSKIRGAMIYPAFILSTMLAIGTLMMVFVVPRLTDVIKETGAELPLTTKILIAISSFFVHYWWILLIVIIILIIAVNVYIETPQGRYVWDLLKIRLPVLGPLYQRVALARFSLSFANLLGSGVPVTQSLNIVSNIVENEVYKDIIQHAIKTVEAGNAIATVFMHSKYVPVIVPQMISVGEETGRLDEILKKLAKFYSGEIDTALETLTSLIEPLIIILLGIGAAVLVFAILTPIYNITNSFA